MLKKSTKDVYIPAPDSGTAFINGYKEPGDNKPDYTGIYSDKEGNIRRLAMWKNEKGYFSIRFSDKRDD